MLKAVFYAVLILLHVTAQAESVWDPSHTHVLVASITEWPAAAGLEPFTGTRRDGEWVEQLKASGVPSANLQFLKDRAATGSAIRNALRSAAERSRPGDSLIFCFQGHGAQKLLCCYDYDRKRPEQTVLHIEEIYPLLQKWQGNRLFLIGDCCGSGSLQIVLQKFNDFRPEVQVATFASAMASNTSTGNWTFTEGLIRIFKGDPLVDRDRDGLISIGEAKEFLHNQMKFKEDQLPSLTLSRNFEPGFILGRVAPGAVVRELPGPYKIGDLLEARDSEGQWYASEIIDGKGAKYKVHFCGWDDKWDEWVDLKRLRRIVKSKLELGQRYEVLWEKRWYPAKVTQVVDDYFYFVHYENYDGEDDEWITSDRARAVGSKERRLPHQFGSMGNRELSAGVLVAARWQGDWYRARITAKVNGLFTVRYDDDMTGELDPNEVVPFSKPEELRIGDRVLACWGSTGIMYPARVQALGPEKVTLRWDDGTSPSQVSAQAIARLRRDTVD